jgi:mono/diheme cytochrome c family protein
VARGGRAPSLALLALSGDDPRAVADTGVRLTLPAAPDWLAFGADARTLVVATRGDARLHRVAVHDTQLTIERSQPLGRPVVALARLEGGARLLVATTDYRPDGSPQPGNHFVQDQLLEVDVDTLGVQRIVRTARRTERQTRAGDVDSGLSPLGLAAQRAGGALIAFAGSDELWTLDALDAEPTRIELTASGVLAPHGVAVLADGTRLVTSPSQSVIALFAPGASTPRLLRLAPDDGALRKHAPHALARRLGERGFYESTRSGVSCQSCHLHADADGSAHNLGDHALLPTLSVRGLIGTAPYLRDGTYGHLADLDWVAQTLYRGYPRLAPARAEQLAAYLSSLPRTPSAVAAGERDRAAERRGLRAFFAAGCPGCHTPPAFTALGQHRPAALFPGHAAPGAYELLDTPSLLSVGASAPYLSDGRAPTLTAVLVDHNRSNRHGDVARLSQLERRDLVRLLESL